MSNDGEMGNIIQAKRLIATCKDRRVSEVVRGLIQMVEVSDEDQRIIDELKKWTPSYIKEGMEEAMEVISGGHTEEDYMINLKCMEFMCRELRGRNE